MSNAIPARRLQLQEASPRQSAAMFRLNSSIELDPQLRELIDVRASQINGCAFCIDMHWQDARAEGESEERLYSLGAWRESPLYSDRERAALGLCEAMTLIAADHVPDATWAQARTQFDDEELAQLVFAIATINTWNRLMTATRAEPGHYHPGQSRQPSTEAAS